MVVHPVSATARATLKANKEYRRKFFIGEMELAAVLRFEEDQAFFSYGTVDGVSLCRITLLPEEHLTYRYSFIVVSLGLEVSQLNQRGVEASEVVTIKTRIPSDDILVKQEPTIPVIEATKKIVFLDRSVATISSNESLREFSQDSDKFCSDEIRVHVSSGVERWCLQIERWVSRHCQLLEQWPVESLSCLGRTWLQGS